MITVAEPHKHIAALWSVPQQRGGRTFRMMRYVLRVDHDGRVLLHNAVTGQLAALDPSEAEAIESLPCGVRPEMEELINAHFLVPEEEDEYRRTVNLKHILHRFTVAEPYDGAAITSYTILPTTACNARCYYCYEHDVPKVLMSEQTADDTVRFIAEHCGPEKKVNIRWFGGEPTTAVRLIDRICEGLRERGIGIISNITTNGYLFDEDMIRKAKALWGLQMAMISVDGTETHYNEIKDYADARDNPYQRVMRNVGLLLKHGIHVNLRMNFDVGNYLDFGELLDEAKERYGHNPLLQVYAFPVKGEYPDKTGQVRHGGLAWSVDRLAELNDAACEAGLLHRNAELPSLFFTNCTAGSPHTMVISPEGNLGRCEAAFEREDQIVGTVTSGIAIRNYCDVWRQLAVPAQCADCTLFPACVLVKGCPGGTDCFKKEEFRKAETAVIRAYERMKTDTKGDVSHDFSGTEGRICAD